MRTCTMALIATLAASPAFAQQTGQAEIPIPEGELTVKSGQPQPRDFGPAPAFADIDRARHGYVNADEAAAYPPLANDFIHADANRDGRVTRAEYERWLHRN